MPTPSKSLEGKRIRLLKSTDPLNQLIIGSEGTVTNVDEAGQVHVDWDNGWNNVLSWDAGDRWNILSR